MGTIVKLLAVTYSMVLFGAFILLVKSKAVKPFYSALWMVISLFMLSFVIFENLWKSLASFLQIESATIFVIVGLISFLLIYVLHLSVKISEISNRTQELITHNAILERELRFLKEIMNPEEGDDEVSPGSITNRNKGGTVS
ncbi:MAG: DUF2304 domain-containing protein [Bacteroidales bacterium]|jgi:hypothetical protein|nr:DUF2304 domain-containing protein [Bacteroidales bacterium]